MFDELSAKSVKRETGTERNRQMVSSISLVCSNRKKRTTSKRSPQFPDGFSGKLLFHLTFNRNFRIFWLNGKHPMSHESMSQGYFSTK